MIEPSSEGFITGIHCPQMPLIPVRAWDSDFFPSPLAYACQPYQAAPHHELSQTTSRQLMSKDQSKGLPALVPGPGRPKRGDGQARTRTIR
jgi:hypothetical protein